MEIGTILHKALELKGQMKMSNLEVDYDYLKKVVSEGFDEECDRSDKHILGISELKEKYFEDFYIPDNKSGMNYEEKIEIFNEEVLPTRMESTIWVPIATEQKFELVYDDRVAIHGFIDRVDKNIETGELKITDYKSSKAVFPDKDVKTPMQHIIYDLACMVLYDKPADVHEYDFILIDKIQEACSSGFPDKDVKTPMQHIIYDLACMVLYDKPADVHEYDFILIDKIQEACSSGYLKRGINKLNKLLDSMDEMSEKGEFPPKPSPLCFYCPYHSTSPNADPMYSGLCQYHSLWTPENKTFATLNPYGQNEYFEPKKEIKSQRKLVF